MRERSPRLFALAVLIALSPSAAGSGAPGDERAVDNWPQWRGPLGTGVAPNADPPIEWSDTKNIRWKIAPPGAGHSTPAVWGDRVFLTTAIPVGDAIEPKPDDSPGAHDNALVTHRYEFVVIAVARADGRTLWQETVRTALPHEGGHVSGSLASNSPVTDGEHVFAFFGSRGLYCFDMDGALVWERDFGPMLTKHGHGEGASPALHGDTLVINWDHRGQSFVVALDASTGRTRWQLDRDEVTSWATPIIVEPDGRPQVIVSGTGRVRSYDLATGEVIWECGGLSRNVVASPVAGDGMVFVGSSYDKQAMLAIRLAGAAGDLTVSDNVVWTRRRRTPYVPSPLLYGEALYFFRHYQPMLSRVNAKTGEETEGPFRLDGLGDIYASPVAAAGRIYVTDLEGVTLVLTDAQTPVPLARNALDDAFSASAAVVGREILLRGRDYLYCIGGRESPP